MHGMGTDYTHIGCGTAPNRHDIPTDLRVIMITIQEAYTFAALHARTAGNHAEPTTLNANRKTEHSTQTETQTRYTCAVGGHLHTLVCVAVVVVRLIRRE